MNTRLGNGDAHWMVRIRISRDVQQKVRELAEEERRTIGTLVGLILQEAVTMPSSA
jgi:hypothetical protein